jgi:glutamate synthase (NADPH) large chain
VGDHGCEYMTGGRVLLIGASGRNFAAGMSGGIAYVYPVRDYRETGKSRGVSNGVYDPDGDFRNKCNMEMVQLEELTGVDLDTIEKMLISHHRYTQSSLARYLLANFLIEMRRFIKVIPKEYKRVLQRRKVQEEPELDEVSDG